MTCEAHIICWNREDSISWTIKHYQKFCSKVFIHDNFSDDKTRLIASDLGATVNVFGVAGYLDDGEYIKLKNNCWKKSHADWVIVVDDDEILYNEDLKFILNQARVLGYTIFKPQGISMHSDSMPKESWLEITKGMKDENYSKLCVFNPQAIKEINYVYGCHEAKPTGRINYAKDQLYLLHYRSVGGVQRLIDRHKLYQSRLAPINKKWNLGAHYLESEETKRKQWAESLERSEELLGRIIGSQ